MSDYWDPVEHLDEAARDDWEVRQHLYAKRRLHDLEERGHTRTQLFEQPEHGDRCCRPGCQRTDVRLVRLTGDVICPAHDPLEVPHWGRPCCGRKEEEG